MLFPGFGKKWSNISTGGVFRTLNNNRKTLIGSRIDLEPKTDMSRFMNFLMYQPYAEVRPAACGYLRLRPAA